MYFLFNRSLPSNFIINPVGVITKKKITTITTGATTEPKILPNLNHNLFKGVKKFELINPKIKKIMATIMDQTLNVFSYNRGHKDMIKKTKKKTIPKLRFEFILILEFFCICIIVSFLYRSLIALLI